jgi:hypothetical protein
MRGGMEKIFAISIIIRAQQTHKRGERKRHGMFLIFVASSQKFHLFMYSQNVHTT